MDFKQKSQSEVRTLKRKAWIAALPAVVLWAGDAAALTPLELLGKNVFFDKISKPEDQQGCGSCHDPQKGWTLPNSHINQTSVVAPGAKPKRHGSIKVPTNAYASFSPQFQSRPAPFIINWIGGNFWDGRAEGYGAPGAPDTAQGASNISDTITWENLVLPDTLAHYQKYLGPTADQALNPFPNKVEQNIRIKRVCKTVRDANYSYLFTTAFGEPITCNNADYPKNYKRIAVALAAYQASTEVNSFSSKRDRALLNDKDPTAGQFPLKGLSPTENAGHDLFYGKAGCNVCHQGVPQGEASDPNGVALHQLYTDNRYHNIGVPFNREIPDVAKGEKVGLSAHAPPTSTVLLPSGTTTIPTPKGHFRTPTMRNVAKGASGSFVKSYFHNGYCKSLECVVHFYNTRDVLPRCSTNDATAYEALRDDCWPAPEFSDALTPSNIVGNLGLTPLEESQLVAYLKTLSDLETPKAPNY
jgi:cytochrome c peroxidase